ncbi:hypothetical protein ACFOQM_14165 [Paenibacillus sp. GCM10012307]|uniref:Uncharacterized protein n=1 Tax=Paenibacillus roseus TaxID=2798579 RepID=A0A934MPT8_9BACL|nr:hypothetical protein [Paenibacillus roseus]MBJ6362426.1 hypothetical protein [Paenibacillus roseus]
MLSPLVEQEVNRLYQLLNEAQISFLQDYIKQNKKSKWLESLARKKGIVLEKNLSSDEAWDKLNDWELQEILDGGYGNRPYRCECGMALRFCYIVRHRKENRTFRLGETCLGNYTLLSADLIKDIINGFHKIDLERDEILNKFELGWTPPLDYASLPLPEDIQKQIDAGLPLSYRQTNRIENLFKPELSRKRKQRELDHLTQLHVRKAAFTARQASQPASFIPPAERITYELVLSRHGEHLNQIKENELRIKNQVMLAKWENVQQMILNLQCHESFDYSGFLAEMFELLYNLDLY